MRPVVTPVPTPAQQRLMDEIEITLAHPQGASGRIRDLEIACGYHPIAVGAWFPFHLSADDWQRDSVVTQSGKEIRIVLVNALHPGYGAFHRLVRTITKAGFMPVVVAPIGPTMPAILKHWGWRRTVKRYEDDQTDEWRPR